MLTPDHQSICLRSLLLSLIALMLVAGGLLAGEVYERKKIKSRAERGYDANGTALYNYNEIDDYSDDLDPEKELGVLEIDRRVREVHSVVIIKDKVNSSSDDLRIGTVESNRSGRLREVTNQVNIDGGVNVRGGKDINIGTIEINNRMHGASDIRNRVDIDGSVDAD